MNYYIEKDGQLFLVERDGILKLPEKKDIPFKVKVLRKFPKINVSYCYPKINHHPEEWPHKDEIPVMENVDPLVRKAVNLSLVRHASDTVIEKDGKILMVKANRGLLTGKWDLPGGFISYGESPEESLIREVKEETGLKIKPKKLIGVYTGVKDLYYTVFIYQSEIIGGKIKPDPSEISEVKWVPIKEALKSEKDIVRKTVRDFKKLNT